jgi:hypothetical protein
MRRISALKRKFPWFKFVIGIILFAFFHELYRFFPSTLTAVLAEGEEETIFAHLKMLFYPYLLISIVDYFIGHRRKTLAPDFVYARMLILVAVPWMMITVFYIPDALGVIFEEPFVLIFSILISWLGVYTAIRLEEPLEAILYRPAVKVLLILFFISIIILFTGFTFREPYYKFFTFKEILRMLI